MSALDQLARAPFADWCEPDEILCLRPEQCRKCTGRVLAGYLIDKNGSCYGWGAQPLGPCGRPDLCGEKVRGITAVSALACWGPQP